MVRQTIRSTGAGGGNTASSQRAASVVRGLSLVLPMRLQLSQRALNVDGRRAVLTAGMSVTVDVVTGRRRVIDYLWSPIAKATQEAGRER